MEVGWIEWILTNLNEAILPLRGLKGELFFLIRLGLVLAAILAPIIILLRIFRESVVVTFSGLRNVHVVEFSDREVVKNAEPLRRVPLFGALIFIPQGTEGIVSTNKSLIPKTYGAGEHVLYYTTLHASVQYVDVRQRSTNFSIRKALCQDGFHITLSGVVSWQVSNVLRAAKVKDPVGEILNEVEVAVRDVISEYDHDQLILNNEAASNQPLINEQELIDIICEKVKATQLFQLFDLHTVVLVKRKGDPKKLPPPPPKPTEAEIRASERKIDLKSRQEMLSVEREIVFHEVQIEREWARARQEMHEREVELEIRRNAERMDLERERMRIQAQTAALTPILRIFAQILNGSPPNWTARRWGINCDNQEELARLLRCLCNDPETLTAEYRFGPRSPNNAKEKLTYRLAELWSIENVIGIKIEESAKGEMGLVVNISTELGTKMAMFLFVLSGIESTISKIYLQSSKGVIFTVPNPALYKNLTLSEVIQRLEDKYGPKKKIIEGSGKWS